MNQIWSPLFASRTKEEIAMKATLAGLRDLRVGILLATSACCLLGEAHAATVDVSSGTVSATIVRDCSLEPSGSCLEAQLTPASQVQFLVDYEAGVDAAKTAASVPLGQLGGQISGSTVSAYDQSTLAPMFHQGAFAPAGARVYTEADSISGYSWNGTGSQDRSLTVSIAYSGTNLDPIDSNDPADANIPFATIGATFDVFSLTTPTFAVTDSYGGAGCSIVGGAVSSCLSAEGADVEISDAVSVLATASAGTVSGTLDFTLEPGRYYFVELSSIAIAKYDSSLDALDTVTATLSSTEGLSALGPVASVPESPCWLTLGAGLAVMGFAFRRKGSQPIRKARVGS